MHERAGRFREVAGWRKSYDLSLTVYKATATFPSDERFGLTQQMRRAAVSIPSNTAEGWGRNTTADYLRFVTISRGSLYELQTQAWLASDLQYIPKTHEIFEQIAEVERILNALYRSLAEKIQHSQHG